MFIWHLSSGVTLCPDPVDILNGMRIFTGNCMYNTFSSDQWPSNINGPSFYHGLSL